MMHISEETFRYYDNIFSAEYQLAKLPQFQMIELPYKSNEISMVIFLPKNKSGLAEFERALTADTLHRVLRKSYDCHVDLWLPRFQLEQTLDLVQLLRGLGIRRLFANAYLSGIESGLLQVSGAVHKAAVRKLLYKNVEER